MAATIGKKQAKLDCLNSNPNNLANKNLDATKKGGSLWLASLFSITPIGSLLSKAHETQEEVDINKEETLLKFMI